MYRPHFAYPTPPGCHDEPFEHFYDASVMQVSPISALGHAYSILFQLDRDAEFRWRGVKLGIQNVSVPLEVRWRDAFGNALCDCVSHSQQTTSPTINTVIYGVGSGFSAAFAGGMAVPWDEEIVCPPGSVIESDWFRPFNTPSVVPQNVTLLGVKRYYGRGEQYGG